MDQPSYWVFKTKVFNKKKNKTITGYSHITYANQNKVRIDVFGPLGLIHAASVVYQDQQFEALLPLEKKYISGEVNEETMMAVLKVPIDPAIFYNLIFQKGFENKDWQCVLDGENKKLRECRNPRARINVKWPKTMSRNGGEFIIEHESGRAEFTFRKYRPLDEIPENKFVLQAPASYKQFKADREGISKL